MTKANIPNTQGTLPSAKLFESILKQYPNIEDWFKNKFKAIHPQILTTSIDLRNAGFKIAPIDVNLFPAGFNNLNPDFLEHAIHSTKNFLQENYPKCKKLLIIPESHTRNINYFESLATLNHILESAGLETQIGSLLELSAPKVIELPSKKTVTLHPVMRENDRIHCQNFEPCLVLLNHDLTDGVPDILKDLKQTMTPITELGWHQRFKTEHFQQYDEICLEFANAFELDPWLLSAPFLYCGEIDFKSEDGLECLIHQSETLFAQIQKKYDQYGIDQSPFIVIKADQGTYGMAVMMIHDIDDIKALNRKQRKKMTSLKGGQTVSRVLIQEGVHSIETKGTQEATAEPVLYMLGQHVIGGFYRFHKDKAHHDNLNAPGMEFSPLAFETCCHEPDFNASIDAQKNQFYTYSVIARLSYLASCLEWQAIVGEKA